MEDDNGDTYEPYGFERGLAPLKIWGATKMMGQLMYLMQWQGEYEADLVHAADANELCPQLVLAYYEEHVIWIPVGGPAYGSDEVEYEETDAEAEDSQESYEEDYEHVIQEGDY